VKTTLTRVSDVGLQTTTAAFTSHVQTSCVPADIKLNVAAREFDEKPELFTNLGSNWILVIIDDGIVHIARYNPYVASSYIKTPEFLENKQCIINVKNKKDNECFKWAMLSALYKPTGDSRCIKSYESHEDKLYFSGLRFPMSLSQIHQFERQNKKVSVNVYLYKPPIVVDPNDEDAVFAH